MELTRGLRTVAATDALIALRAGYQTCTLGGVDDTKFPSNYHWPSDTPDNLGRLVGVDLTDPDFWTAGLRVVDELVTEAEKLADAQG